ncbi:MAG: glycerol kinase GlpK [Bacteroidales bacterium]|nr:glycerol kinase GlpK [Bacteroidales bacterium]
MSNKKYILALDQGTTSSRAILFDATGTICGVAQQEFSQYFPKPGFVEHDPEDIYRSQVQVARKVLEKTGITYRQIDSIGITNQRETTIVWDRKTGKPVYRAIVWQDRRTAPFCNRLKKEGYVDLIRMKTGLEIDAYFSGTKINWILDNVAGARQRAERGELAFGTVDTWLMWHLSGGKVHLTDVSNASRTLLFNIHTLQWDDELLKIFNIPVSMLPEVRSNSDLFTETSVFRGPVPVTGVAGDQQAALFGQMCIHQGMVKNTYGTGCFIMLNTGNEPVVSSHRLLTTVGWQLNGETTYALEGSVFVGGAVIQWLRDALEFINDSSESEALAASAEDNGGVYFVPAFTGLGAPYWNPDARGLIYGLSRGSTKAHIMRAALESVAFQSYDVLKAMEQDAGFPIDTLRVDGGASANNLLMQFQSDLLQTAVQRPKVVESTSLGAAYFAGLHTGFWSGVEEIEKQWAVERTFLPLQEPSAVQPLLEEWKKVVSVLNGAY